LFVVGVVFSIYYFDGRKKKEALTRLSHRIRGTVGGFFQQSLRGSYEGVRFALILIPAGKNTPPYLTLEFFKTLPFTLQVTGENAFTRLGEKWGLVKDIAVHDPAFDKRFFVRSDDPRKAASFLENVEVRRVIMAFFDKGFDVLSVDKKHLYIRKPHYAFPNDLDAVCVEALFRDLLIFLRTP